MHFTWEVSFGQVIVSIPIFWVIYSLWKITQMLFRFRIEHEDLMIDWCAWQTPPKRLMELPTRSSKWW